MKPNLKCALRLSPLYLLALGAAATPTDTARAGAATPAGISIPGERVFPESLTSTRNGTVIIGSIGEQALFRVKPGASEAEHWVAADSIEGMQSPFGVFADEAAGTLWVCSNRAGPPQPGAAPIPATLFALDLKKGTLKGSFPLPATGAMCNDIGIDAKGNAYVTDTRNMLVARLPKGGDALEIWAGSDGEFGPKGGVLDGIAVVGNRVLVSALLTSKFFGVPIGKDGKPGEVRELTFSRTVEQPDGIRAHGKHGLLIAETGGGGKVALVELSGDEGTVTTLKEGLAGGPVSVTVVGKTVYALEGQLGLMMRPTAGKKPEPFRAVAVPLQ